MDTASNPKCLAHRTHCIPAFENTATGSHLRWKSKSYHQYPLRASTAGLDVMNSNQPPQKMIGTSKIQIQGTS